MDRLIPFITTMTMFVPNLIVWLVGIGLALARWRRHPRVSLLALIAFIISIVFGTLSRFLNVWLPMTMREEGWAMAQVGSVLTIIGAVTSLISAAAWILVLCAIFGWRAGQRQQSFIPPPPPSFAGTPREPETTTGIS